MGQTGFHILRKNTTTTPNLYDLALVTHRSTHNSRFIPEATHSRQKENRPYCRREPHVKQPKKDGDMRAASAQHPVGRHGYSDLRRELARGLQR